MENRNNVEKNSSDLSRVDYAVAAVAGAGAAAVGAASAGAGAAVAGVVAAAAVAGVVAAGAAADIYNGKRAGLFGTALLVGASLGAGFVCIRVVEELKTPLQVYLHSSRGVEGSGSGFESGLYLVVDGRNGQRNVYEIGEDGRGVLFEDLKNSRLEGLAQTQSKDLSVKYDELRASVLEAYDSARASGVEEQK